MTIMLSAEERSLFAGGRATQEPPRLAPDEQERYERETALSWAYSRWLAAPLGSDEERAAWREVLRFRGEGR